MLYWNCKLHFWNLNRSSPLHSWKCSYHLWLFPIGFNSLKLMGWIKRLYCCFQRYFLNEIKPHIEIPKTKFWRQPAFQIRWNVQVSDDLSALEVAPFIFKRYFPTSDASARQKNIKELRKVTILLCNPRLVVGWGVRALRVFLEERKNWNLFWMPC